MLKGMKKLILVPVLVVCLLSQALCVCASDERSHGGLEPVTAVQLSMEEAAKYSSGRFCTETRILAEADTAYWTKFRSDYYYNYLSAPEKEFWDAMEEFCITMATTTTDFSGISWISCDTSISYKRIRTIMTLFIYSNPQYYFIEPYITYASGGASLSLYADFRDGEARASYTASFTSVLDKWVTRVSAATLPEEKVRLIHDIVCKNANFAYNDYDQSAYSLIFLGGSSCTGYAKVVSMLGNATGVETAIATSSNHAWNLVRLHDAWYELDAFCDDGYGSNYYYDFYLKSRSTLLADTYANHSIADLHSGMMPATLYDAVPGYSYTTPYLSAEGNTYFIINGNPSLGDLLAVRVSGSNVIPASITYNNSTYTLVGGSTWSAATDSEAEVEAFVERMYTIALERDADKSGVAFWSEQLLSGENDGAGLARGFLLSTEFTAKNYSNAKYVEILYLTFFNRSADEGGQAYWVSAMNSGMSREQVLAGFVNSGEFFTLCKDYGIYRGLLLEDGSAIHPGIYRFSARLYTTVLERDGDRDGIDYWASQLASGALSPGDAAKSFFFSQEYLDMETSDEKYIMTLYRTFMDRETDLGGLLYWKEMLQGGTSREAVLNGFATSGEFQQISAGYGL